MRYVGNEEEFFTCYLGCGEAVPYWEIVLEKYKYAKPKAYFLSEGFSLDKEVFVKFISFLDGTSFGAREDFSKSKKLSVIDFRDSFFYAQSHYNYYRLSNMVLRCPNCHRYYDGRTKTHDYFSATIKEADRDVFGIIPINGRLFNSFTVVGMEDIEEYDE